MGLAPNQVPADLKEQVHIEYVTTELSLRKVALKFGLSRSTVGKWARDGLWQQEKELHLIEAQKAAIDHFKAESDHHIDLLAERTRRIYNSADKLLDKVDQLLDLDDALSPRDLKSISSTLLDIKMIHNIKDEDDKVDNTVHVVFDEWED